MQDAEILSMTADYMERGFLENIIDMFRHDRTLYPLVPSLMADERSRVRIGAVALVESLREEHREEIVGMIPQIGPLLRHENPTFRADAVYLLEVIGHRDALPFLQSAKEEETEQAVMQVIEEAVRELKQKR